MNTNKSKIAFDIADEIFDIKNEDKYIIRQEKAGKYCKICEIEIKSDKNPYSKRKGYYTSIEFLDLQDNSVYKEVRKYLTEYISEFVNALVKKKKKSILIVGIGNETYSPDALGPKVTRRIVPTSHIKSKSIKNKISCIVPGVMGTTGLESLSIVKGIINENKFDLVIVIDSLTTNSITRLNHVIQITDTGMVPGSGVNNSRKEFTKESLGIPLICIGIATVISLNSLCQEIINGVGIKRKIRLKNEDNLMLTSKEIESRIEILTLLISESINYSLHQ